MYEVSVGDGTAGVSYFGVRKCLILEFGSSLEEKNQPCNIFIHRTLIADLLLDLRLFGELLRELE